MLCSRTYIGLATAALCGLLLPNPAAAQICADSSTTIYWVNHLSRTASNNVDALAGTQIVGDYWYTWAATISSTEQIGSTTIHTGSASVGYGGNNGFVAGGTAVGLQWDDSPSTRGAGAYSLLNDHGAYSECGGGVLTQVTYDSLTVNQPTITGNNSVWYLGSGQTQTGYSYINPMTANSNCGPSDTCNDTPTWTATNNPSEIYLSCNPCVNQTVYAEARSNTYQDIQLTVSIGGFASSPMPFTVYAPYKIICCNQVSDAAVSDGFRTTVGLDLYDVFGDHLLYLAVNESFTATLVPDYPGGISGYIAPTASGIAAGWGGVNGFGDKMGQPGGCASLIPLCTNPQNPLSSVTAFHNNQNWFAGSQNPGQGVWVTTDTQQFYIDHARYSYLYSPVYP